MITKYKHQPISFNEPLFIFENYHYRSKDKIIADVTLTFKERKEFRAGISTANRMSGWDEGGKVRKNDQQWLKFHS